MKQGNEEISLQIGFIPMQEIALTYGQDQDYTFR